MWYPKNGVGNSIGKSHDILNNRDVMREIDFGCVVVPMFVVNVACDEVVRVIFHARLLLHGGGWLLKQCRSNGGWLE